MCRFHVVKQVLQQLRLRSVTLDSTQHMCGAYDVNFTVQEDMYRGADKSLARPTSRCILFDGDNISFDVCLVVYINSTNISPITIINRIHENQNLLSL
jgi:hypothetical protein